MSEALVRIGELARRAGVPPATLRAWERRYGIVTPARTEGGYRLYSAEDERRLKLMVEWITRGLAPAQAAQRALTPAGSGDAPGAGEPADQGARAESLREDLLERLADLDEAGANGVIDRATTVFGADALLGQLILPVMRRIGERWQVGDLTIGDEHFASNLIRARVLALGRGWGGGSGPLALLACPPGEAHDLGLACFGVLLRERGWRVAFLGADTPLETVATTARRVGPRIIVLPITLPATADALRAEAPLSLGAPVAVGGAAADPELAAEIGAQLLDGGLIAAAEQLAGTVAAD